MFLNGKLAHFFIYWETNNLLPLWIKSLKDCQHSSEFLHLTKKDDQSISQKDAYPCQSAGVNQKQLKIHWMDQANIYSGDSQLTNSN